MFKKRNSLFKNLVNKILFRIRLELMDELWLLSEPIFRNTPYPPSFYYYHTPKEIKQMEEEEIIHLRVMVAEIGRRDAEDKLREEVRKMETEFHKIEAKTRKKGTFHQFF